MELATNCFPGSGAFGGAILLASLRSGLYWTRDPSSLPATSCFPLGDQDTQRIFSPAGRVAVSNPFSFGMYNARLPSEYTTESIDGWTGFHNISEILTPAGFWDGISMKGLVLFDGEWKSEEKERVSNKYISGFPVDGSVNATANIFSSALMLRCVGVDGKGVVDLQSFAPARTLSFLLADNVLEFQLQATSSLFSNSEISTATKEL